MRSCSGYELYWHHYGGNNTAAFIQNGQWQVSLGYRHFKSFRHFRGKHEESNRVAEGTEVINLFNSLDLGISYAITNRLSFALTLPITMNDRSSMYEHYGNSIAANPDRKRFETQSFGIGDLRISTTYWLFDPEIHHNGNFALGLGVKAPTGNANVHDDFHKLDEEGRDYIIRRAVDQSIQLGDGGWGINLEVQGYQRLFNNAALYFNAFYLLSPRNVNNTLRNINLDPKDPFSYLSVPDQYAARIGMTYFTKASIGLSLGGRIEGIPAKDAIGKEEGFRRPGYIISVEPGASYTHNALLFSLNVPIALIRDRIRNIRDIQTGGHGDAAFADYLINATVAYQFSGKKKPQLKSWEELNHK